MASAPSFSDILQNRVDDVDSLLCVGLDPHVDELPEPTATAAAAFCKNLVVKTLPFAAAFKPNAAFFEVFGAEGHAALVDVLATIPSGVPVIYDAKRGDIGSTSDAYAVASLGEKAIGGGSFGGLGCSAVTANPFMGGDSLEPFLRDPSKGAFLLCKTSNPGSDHIQTLETTRGGMVYEEVARLASTEWSTRGNVGLVVGAMDAKALGRCRQIAPHLWFLSPGLGFQGGNLEEACAAGLRLSISKSGATSATGVLFPVSRGISQSSDPAAAARDLRARINAARAAKVAEYEATQLGNRGASGGEPLPLAVYQKAFIDFAVEHEVLRFGDFTLKSGRQ